MTGFPEMLDGRVKTLHPTIHGGLLARRDVPAHMAALAAARHRARSTCWSSTSIRSRPRSRRPTARSTRRSRTSTSAARRCCARRRRTGTTSPCSPTPRSTPACWPSSKRDGARRPRHALRARGGGASTASATTTRAISDYLSSLQPTTAARSEFPAQTQRPLRQAAGPALRREPASGRRLLPRPASRARLARHGAPAAGQGAVVQQHRRCRRGLGMREELRSGAQRGLRHRQARQPVRRRARRRRRRGLRARPSRPIRPRPSAASSPSTARVDGAAAERVARQFVEVLIAPRYTAEALQVFAAKANLRLLEIALDGVQRDARPPGARAQRARREARRLGAADAERRQPRAGPRRAEAGDAARADASSSSTTCCSPGSVAKYVKSNAIVFCEGGMTLGVGAGQMSRVDSARIASIKAAERRACRCRLGGGERRLLPVPRRPRRRHRCRRQLRDPARRQRCATTRSSPPPTSAASRWCSPACAISGIEPHAGARPYHRAAMSAARRRRPSPRLSRPPDHRRAGTLARQPAEGRAAHLLRQPPEPFRLGADLGRAAARAARRDAADRGARILDGEPVRQWLTREVFNAVYVSRTRGDADRGPARAAGRGAGQRRFAGHLSGGHAQPPRAAAAVQVRAVSTSPSASPRCR